MITHFTEAAIGSVLSEKVVLINFIGKPLCWSLLLIKLLQRDSNIDGFCEVCKTFKKTYFEEHLLKAATEFRTMLPFIAINGSIDIKGKIGLK